LYIFADSLVALALGNYRDRSLIARESKGWIGNSAWAADIVVVERDTWRAAAQWEELA
jgi:hypothetical protein